MLNLESFLKQSTTDASLCKLLSHLAQAGITIADLVRQGALQGVTEKLASTNVQGETQMQLDIESHNLALQEIRASGVVAALLSEEVDEVIDLNCASAPFVVSMDPLDGSSNLAINGVVGSIFSVLPNPDKQKLSEQAFLQAGRHQLAALYVMYGPATLLVLTVGKGTHIFTYDVTSKQFLLTQADVSIAKQTSEFAINASNQRYWQAPMQRYISECLQGSAGPRGRDFNMRWCASMVMDVHRILTRGGVFLYPRDTKQPIKAGRLRLLYEANPMSLLVTQAGGDSIDGEQAVLDIQPTQCHQRVPVLLGAQEEIALLQAYHLAQ